MCQARELAARYIGNRYGQIDHEHVRAYQFDQRFLAVESEPAALGAGHGIGWDIAFPE